MIVNMYGNTSAAEYDGSYSYLSLENMSWDEISYISKYSSASSVFSIGDTKSVHLQGTCGTLSLDTTLYAYIIGINHRDVNGITFQVFKTADSDMISVCLVNNYDSENSTGSLAYFNMNHWGSSSDPYNTNYGGWAGCDLRYDILGSTNIPPSGYGSIPTTSRKGDNAGTSTATNPVANTLMSCLPSDLRAVMQPMTIYTDNKGNYSTSESNVTTSIDYLPLLSEYELSGIRTLANPYEKNNQTQYAYYAAGNSKAKYNYSDRNTSVHWWIRSPDFSSSNEFCFVYRGGGSNSGRKSSKYSSGLAPMFMV